MKQHVPQRPNSRCFLYAFLSTRPTTYDFWNYREFRFLFLESRRFIDVVNLETPNCIIQLFKLIFKASQITDRFQKLKRGGQASNAGGNTVYVDDVARTQWAEIQNKQKTFCKIPNSPTNINL
jgi:hypothetical protein